MLLVVFQQAATPDTQLLRGRQFRHLFLADARCNTGVADVAVDTVEAIEQALGVFIPMSRSATRGLDSLPGFG
jgi:hypothetical protein